jgi:NADH-quinone oxidoreductase subunit L
MEELAHEWAGFAADGSGPLHMGLHGFVTLPFFLALAGVAAAWYCYLVNPRVPAWFARNFAVLYRLLENKYYFDRFNDLVFAGGARRIGAGLWKGGDVAVIDGIAINGSARVVGWFAAAIRTLQSGYIYHYAFAMLAGIALLLFAFMTWPYVMGGR